ncbi:hypothetical protein [Edaphobacter sp.]|uniref:hypothetical protein n=1 Tax=Edaphobacter sp. TaxID=1934404 RepID=UPI002DB8CF87|nr:hypothetical protein [Edaphobacter sp.]HEU5341531.1 hypothetical protein [Edaphobacter sp.]
MPSTGSSSRKSRTRSSATRSVPCVASQVYSASVRPSSEVMVRSAATISGSGVGVAGGPARIGSLGRTGSVASRLPGVAMGASLLDHADG